MLELIGKSADIISLILCIYTFVMWRKYKTNVIEAMGLKTKNSIILETLVGLGISLIAMIGIFLTQYSLNLVKIDGVNSINSQLLFFTGQIFMGALVEELIYRSIALNGLMFIFKNKYIVVIFTAILFGIVHAANPSASVISILSNALGGVMYSIAFLGSRSLWLSLSLHFAWNFFQGPILGFPISGFMMGGLLNQTPVLTNPLLNGGNYGPEGGLIGIFFRFVIILLLLLYFNFVSKKKNA